MTVDWPVVELGAQLRVKHGFAFKGAYFGESGDFIVVTPGNFYDEGGFKPKDGTEKFYTAQPPAEYVLKRNDLVVAMTEQVQGLLGSSALIPCDGTYLHNQRIGLVELVGDVDRRFIYYLFNTPLVRDQIQATATGSKVRHTAPSRIEAVKVRLPPRTTQRKIGAILSQYDDLIENNRRRIKVLEEIAHQIYREWFIDVRYPGHAARELDGAQPPIPEGWTWRELGELVEDVRESVAPQSIPASTPYFGLEHLPEHSLALDRWGTADQVISLKLRFQLGDVLFGKIRPYFHKVGPPPVPGICSTDAMVLRAREPHDGMLVLAVVSSDAFVAHAVQTSQGTKMPRANWRVLQSYRIPYPDAHTLAAFDDHLTALIGQIHALVMANRTLREARDVLLPRLVSGDIDVEGLAISMEEAAA